MRTRKNNEKTKKEEILLIKLKILPKVSLLYYEKTIVTPIITNN